MMKIIFMGSPEFAIPTLKELINSKHQIVRIYTQGPKSSGRGHKQNLTPVHSLALEANIAVSTPKTLRSAEALEEFNSYGADIAIVAAYGLILPKEILASPKYGCINLHPSDLPKYRGAAPIQRTILAGDDKTAICTMQMDEGLDTGDVLLKKDITFETNLTSGQWHDIAADIGSKMILDTIDNIDNIIPIKQANAQITYANKLKKEEGLINWQNTAQEIERLIRGLNPWPIAFFQYMGEDIKIHKAEIIDLEGKPGTVIDDNLTIACGEKAIRPTLIQRPSRKIMQTDEMLKGYKIILGADLNAKI